MIKFCYFVYVLQISGGDTPNGFLFELWVISYRNFYSEGFRVFGGAGESLNHIFKKSG